MNRTEVAIGFLGLVAVLYWVVVVHDVYRWRMDCWWRYGRGDYRIEMMERGLSPEKPDFWQLLLLRQKLK